VSTVFVKTYVHCCLLNLGNEDSASSQWVEQKDDLIRPISGFTFIMCTGSC